MYTEIGKVSEATVAELLSIIPEIKWQLCERELTEVHQMAGCMDLVKGIPALTESWPLDMWEQAIFLRLRPGDHLFNHVDSGWGVTIPIETNADAVSLSSLEETGVQTECRLEVGRAYLTNRSRWHEAFNNGASDRTHFILIMKEL